MKSKKTNPKKIKITGSREIDNDTLSQVDDLCLYYAEYEDSYIDSLYLVSCNHSFREFAYLNFEMCVFKDCIFNSCNFDNSTFLNCKFIDCDFSSCKFDKAHLDRVTIINSRFSNNH